MSRKFFTAFILPFVLLTAVANAYVAESPSYRLESDSVNFLGGSQSSGSYNLESTAGEVGTGYSDGGNSSNLHAGFQQSANPSTIILGCTNPAANNYNPLANQDDGNCEFGGNQEIEGCTDPAANNYNPRATRNNGSCVYAVPNVNNFRAVYQDNQSRVKLNWENPVFPQFQAVRVVRGTGIVPANPNDGLLIYDGPAEVAFDYEIEKGKTYYYVAFVRSSSGAYSSGALAWVAIPSGETPPPCEGDDCDGDGGGPGPDFPPASTTISVSPGDFFFVQPGGIPKALLSGGLITLDGKKPTTVYIAYDRLPETLKTIVVTLVDPDNPNRTFSFLLSVNENKTRYSATIGPLFKSGTYRVIIHVLNYRDQSLSRLEGSLLVAGVSGLSFPVTTKTLLPATVLSGIAVGVAQVVLLTTRAKSLYDIYLLLLRAIGALSGILGLRKRHTPWGTVYDAVTKRPIDPAIVQVYQNGKEVTSAITDLDGRYGFLLPPGTYEIKAGKTHYRFPSEKLAGRTSDVLYNNLYFGDPIATAESEIIDRNIPLDPISFDWNEFMKNKAALYKLKTHRELIRSRIFNTIFYIGFAITLFAVAVTPSVLNFLILGSYFALMIFEYFWKATHRIIAVQKSGQPLPFAIVTFWLPDLNQRMKSVVTDELGRFYALVSPGTYYLTIDEKLPDGSYQTIHKTRNVVLNKGVLNSDINIPA